MGEELRRELKECQDEVPKMEELGKKIDDILAKKLATGDVLKKLEQQRTQLSKDIENYKHMLEEADDLRKSWDKDETKMNLINQDRRFTESANVFELTINDLKNQPEKSIAPAKAVDDRIKFTRYDAGGGQIVDLPILFEFGLLNKHAMGGWEDTRKPGDNDDFFSFTFRWDEENYEPHNVMEELRIKATSIVVLWDEETHTIVNFDVEPGFEHQWGYGRQRFLKQSTLSANSNTVRAQAIIKEWSEQHEYELGKYAIELLKQSKSSRADTIRHVNFIVDQANEESKLSAATLEKQKAELENQLKISEQNKAELLSKRQSLEEEIARLKIELANKTTEVDTQKAEVQRLQQELNDAQTQIQEGGTQQTTDGSGDGEDNGDTGSNQVARDPNLSIISDLKEQVEAKDSEIEDLKKQIEELTNKVADFDKLKEELEKLKEENEKLKGDVQAKQD